MSKEQTVETVFSALMQAAMNENGKWVKRGDISVNASEDAITHTLQTMEELGWLKRRTDRGKHYYITEQTEILAEALRDPDLDVFPGATEL